MFNEGPMPEDEVRNVVRQVAGALAHCHARDLVHRDIKPDNIFRTGSGQVKIGDFGLGEWATRRMRLGDAWGSGIFAAPQMHRGKEYGQKCDVWSLGVTAWKLLSGPGDIWPFSRREVSPGDKDTWPYSAKINEVEGEVSDEFSSLIWAMLSQAEDSRPTAKEVEAKLMVRRLPILVWRDPSVRNCENDGWVMTTQADFADDLTLIACESDEDALCVIAQARRANGSCKKVWVMTNRGDPPPPKVAGQPRVLGRETAPAFINACRRAGVTNEIRVFCKAVTGWKPMEGVVVDVSPEAPLGFVKEILETHRERAKAKASKT
jgi:hypothetical protein